jgi:hypothetical protein
VTTREAIQVDVDSVSGKLREINLWLGGPTPVVQSGRDAQEVIAERAELLRKLEALKSERLAASNAEMQARRCGVNHAAGHVDA